ncbi:hypothetical protein ACFX1X_028365 [Malus domestica]
MAISEISFTLFLVISLLSSETCNAKDRHNVHNTSALGVYSVNPLREDNYKCAPSSCGNIHNISYPFRLNSSPKRCGHSSFTLFCENNVTVLHISSGKYLVQSINYRNKTIRVVDPGLHKNNCSSIPRYPLSESNFRYSDSPYFSSSTLRIWRMDARPMEGRWCYQMLSAQHPWFFSTSIGADSRLCVETTISLR